MQLQDFHGFFLLFFDSLLKGQLDTLCLDFGLLVNALQRVALCGDLKTLMKRRSVGSLDDVVGLLLHLFFVLSLLSLVLEVDGIDEAVSKPHIAAD